MEIETLEGASVGTAATAPTTEEKIVRLPQNAADLITLRRELQGEIADILERINRAQTQLAQKRNRLAKVDERIEEEKAAGTNFAEAAKKKIAEEEARIAAMKAEFGL